MIASTAKSDPRQIVKAIATKHLLGPCNDTYIGDDESEVITEPPLEKYFTGIVFPNLDNDAHQEVSALDEDIDLIEDILLQEETTDNDPNSIEIESAIEATKEDVAQDDFMRIELYPNTFGISFCVFSRAEYVEAELSFANYNVINPDDEHIPKRKIRLKPEDYEIIKALNTGNNDFLGKLIGYDSKEQAVYLSRKLRAPNNENESEDISDLMKIKRTIYERIVKSQKDEKERYSRILKILRIVTPLYQKAWIRTPQTKRITFSLSDLDKQKTLSLPKEVVSENLAYCIHIVQLFKASEYIVLKILVENCSPYNRTKSIILNTSALNKACMFQCQITLQSREIMPMPKQPLSKYSSLEDRIIECQYREANVFAQSHNCACSWAQTLDGATTIKTEYMPTIIPSVTKNSRDPNFEQALRVKDNSLFGDDSHVVVINRLRDFATSYQDWISSQSYKASNMDGDYQETAQKIVANQIEALSRMNSGIEILQRAPNIMYLFKLTNSAMLVNMTKNYAAINQIELMQSSTICYHPFQLAFLLINIESIVNIKSSIRENSIDLLWFPTGGGKTEAYFLLATFSLLYRRYKHGKAGLGTSVIIRYTLRLLTAQQFSRASKMILSINYVCSIFKPELIDESPYTIGLWIGSASSPNKLFDGENSADDINNRIIESNSLDEAIKNCKFPINSCPWCGQSLIQLGRTGFRCHSNKFEIFCLNPDCHFHSGLPIDIVDESIYNNPPSILFATVDKFARLAWVDKSASLFGSTNGYYPPDLIIQDELHLISGPLGSITALFEGIVEMLCNGKGIRPRIVASTATIKNASAQVKNFFGNRDVFTFPPPGIDFGDNFFAKIDNNNMNREYIGFLPTGKTATTSQIKLIALLLYSRWKLKGNIEEDIDDYWTIVSYYNSLRDLGRMFSKVRDEIQQSYSQLILKDDPFRKINRINYPRELTSRISSYEIKSVLHSLESKNIDGGNLEDSCRKAIDLVFATNMISVGLDIERLNLILMNGQPKGVSEYIQVTSRIARNHPGLVFSLFNPFKIRDKSHYENFASFHCHYYRYVEPISITPYTRVAIRKMMPTLMAAYLRLVVDKTNLAEVKVKDMDALIEFMNSRMDDNEMIRFFKSKINEHLDFLSERLSMDSSLSFDDLLRNSSDISTDESIDGDWLTMNSMREISPNSVIKLTVSRPKKGNRDYE